MSRIWLTGASSGIGAALAETLLQQGHQLALTARSPAPLQTLAMRYPGQVLLAPGDLTDAEQVAAIGQRIEQAWGALEQLIVNAGTCEYLEPGQFDATLVERVVRGNLYSASLTVQYALPLLRRGQRPHLVAMCSAATYLALPRAGAYGASKAAMRYLFESLRIDLTAMGIDVTLVSPGFVDTPLTRRNDFPMPMRWPAERAARYIAQRLPRRPYEIAFPLPFIVLLRLLGALPAACRLAIGRRLARPAKES
ncbi:SDR family NAD(P)-dependent oxidoreductase [Pseudomonas panipatensis]|uniref:Short-chain dehydrogenase n=1 Tax=Pseudomonas panipatensis TaxID=428992 RepID=A0A1G8I5U6_9PSED|nr:SDR family NAD(P)-dependent oxidoreductase [Pseudomonas panipatensis]SDI14202.1 Short-chain dehydrogenase [Pseudomonas panipatensis]SMP76016.1 Short-chain dehydrogenase [Pseudomonas panipatensis]